jgi:hypothetical protein
MKKIYALIISFIPLLSLAQPTVMQSDLPVAGLVSQTGIDNAYTSAMTPGGASQTWDYSTLLNNSQGGLSFSSAVGTPFTTYFPTANLVTYDTSGGGSYQYFTTNSSGFYTNGIAQGGGAFVFNPAQLIFPVPFTYGSTANNTSRLQVDTSLSGFAYRIVHSVISSFEGDGWGTLMIPGNTISNTLRIKETDVTIDSTFLNIGFGYTLTGPPDVVGTTTFYWVQHGGPDIFLLQLQADSLGTTTNYSEYKVSSAVAVPEINHLDKAVCTYPNPAQDVVHLDFNSTSVTGTVKIYNSVGEEVKKYDLNSINHFAFYVNDYKNGLYHFVVDSPADFRHGSFVVNH